MICCLKRKLYLVIKNLHLSWLFSPTFGVQIMFWINECTRRIRSYGKAKITPAFNLPSKFVPHTVGLIINKSVIENDRSLLADCYRSCLELAKKSGLKSVAFCCIITGEFRFQNQQAAEIAVQTVQDFLAKNPEMSVIFNVFKEIDLIIYQKLL